MLKFTFCPTFSIFTFIFIITFLEILMYLITLCWTMFESGESLDSSIFLGPSYDVLMKCGAKNDYKILYDYQIYRLLTPIFLHNGFVHIFVRKL